MPDKERDECLPYRELVRFLEDVVDRFQKAKRPGERIKDVLSEVDEEGALYLPEDCNFMDGAQALIYAAEKSIGVGALRLWLGKLSPLQRQRMSLFELVEGMSCDGDLM